MIFTRIKINNFFSFKNAELDLSIKRKIVDSTVPDEFLDGYENFRFRRVCIISGTNASGKTSLGRLMLVMQNFILNNQFTFDFKEYIFNKDELASIEVEFVLPNLIKKRLHRLRLEVKQNAILGLNYCDMPLRASDTVNSARNRLDSNSASNIRHLNSIDSSVATSYEKMLSLINPTELGAFSWLYTLSDMSTSYEVVSVATKSIEEDVLKAVISTFDPSIVDVKQVKDGDSDTLRGFALVFANSDTVLLDMKGKVTAHQRLSRGTLDAISVVYMLCRIRSDAQRLKESEGSAVYYLDEQMAYAHSEIEQAMLNLIIEHLPHQAQIFYTTHNYDVLDMNLPVHSYVFLRKAGHFCEIIQPENQIKQNDRSLLNYVKNNAFHTLPDTSQIEGLM